jgi:hypothetical protein
MKSLSDLKTEFMNSDMEVGYDWDGGHAYSYLKSTPNAEHLSADEQYEFEDFCNDVLYNNDDNLPPCEIHLDENFIVHSSCGCHDHLDYGKDGDKQEIEWALNWFKEAKKVV